MVEKGSASGYADALEDLDRSAAVRDLAYQIFEVSDIASKKFKAYNLLLWGLAVQFLCFVAILFKLY